MGKTKKGYATILVIMLALSLIIFGVIGVISAKNGEKLARANAKQNERYFYFYGKGREVLFFIAEAFENGKSYKDVVFEVKDKFKDVDEIGYEVPNKLIRMVLRDNKGNDYILRATFPHDNGEFEITESRLGIKEIEIDGEF